MFKHAIFLALLLLGLSACQTSEQVIATNIRITPRHYEMDGLRLLSVTDVVNEVVDKKVTKVNIWACALMPTQRVVDLMSELGSRYKGHVSLGTTDVSCASR